MAQILFGGAVLASFLAGIVALFAPCCISVMLPAYFASSFATRRALVAMTFVFATGLALIILPIALGAAAIGTLISAHHLLFYLGGGTLMLALGLYVLVGGKQMLPMPRWERVVAAAPWPCSRSVRSPACRRPVAHRCSLALPRSQAQADLFRTHLSSEWPTSSEWCSRSL